MFSPGQENCFLGTYYFSQGRYRNARAVLTHYHHERIHQGINRIIEPRYGGNDGEIVCIDRLGGLLKSYHREAA